MSTLSPRRQVGLTMVELLVALAVGLFLTAGIIQLLATSNQTARAVDASSFVQENARFALATLAHDIRMAGFLGCRSVRDDGLPVISSSASFDGDVSRGGRPLALFGLAAAATPPWSLGSVQRVPGSDAIQAFSARGDGTTLDAPLTSGAAELVLAGNPDGLKGRDVAVITDCQDAAIFTVLGVSGNRVQHSGVGKPYGKGARVFPLVANAYVVGTRPGSPCAQRSCLYKVPLGRGNASGGLIPAQDLVAAEDLRLRFGEATAGGLVYRTASEVVDWDRVYSVRLGLLVGSESEVTSKPQRYVFADPAAVQDLTQGEPPYTLAGDRRLRSAYWLTVALRNAVP